MKKLFTFIAVFILFSFNASFSQDIVSTDPQPRNVVLEEFTGIYCGFCPYGHEIGQAIQDNNPGRVVLINIHAGSYANPQPGSGHPDFRTPYGDALVQMSNLAGYPAGQVNRQLFSGEEYQQQRAGALALSRGGWEAASNVILADGNSPVNIGAKVERKSLTTLEITVELYYTSDVSQNNKLNVVLLENGFVGYQGGSKGGDDYVHNHILRDMITGQWGEVISETSQGSLVTKTYTYELTDRVDPLGSELQLAFFVTGADNKYIYTGTGIEVPGIEPNAKLTTTDEPLKAIFSGSTVEKTAALENISDMEITFDITLSAISETAAGWQAGLKYPDITPLTLAPGESREISYYITSDNEYGKMSVELNAAEKETELMLSYSDGLKVISADAENFLVADKAEESYSIKQFIQDAGYYDFLEIYPEEYEFISNLMSNAETIVWDAGVNYSLTTNDINSLINKMNNDVNLLILGNRIIGNLSGANALGFFGTNYLGYSTQGYGSSPWRVWLSGVSGDPITGSLGLNFEGNLIQWLISIVEITDPQTTTPILHFTNTGKRVIYNSQTQTRDTFDIKGEDAVFGVKIDKGASKHVLIGITPYVIVDQNRREIIVREALNWINGVVDVEDNSLNASSNVSASPNPAENFLNLRYNITGTKSSQVSIKVVDNFGRIVACTKTMHLNPGNYTEYLDLRKISAGSYNVLVSINGKTETEKIIVIK